MPLKPYQTYSFIRKISSTNELKHSFSSLNVLFQALDIEFNNIIPKNVLLKKNYIKAGGYEEHPVFSGYDCAGAADLRARFGNMGLDCYWNDDLKIYHPCHKGGYDSDRWSGFRVESQWKLINKRNKLNNYIKPFIGIDGRYRETDEWWEDWLGEFDDKTIDYQFDSTLID